MENNIIKCPTCKTEINVSDILFHQIQDQLTKEFETKNAFKDKDLQEKLKNLQKEKDQLAKDKEAVQEQVDAAVKTKLSAEKTKLEKSVREQLNSENAEQIKAT